MKPQRVSSNLTLGLKIFLPTVWVVFFGTFTLAFLFSGSTPGGINPWTFRILWTIGFLLIFLLIRQTLWKLKRVEIDDNFVYITDYFKTARYPFHNIKKIQSFSMGFMWVGVIHFKVPGIFGPRSFFIQKRSAFLEIIPAVEGLREMVQEKE